MVFRRHQVVPRWGNPVHQKYFWLQSTAPPVVASVCCKKISRTRARARSAWCARSNATVQGQTRHGTRASQASQEKRVACAAPSFTIWTVKQIKVHESVCTNSHTASGMAQRGSSRRVQMTRRPWRAALIIAGDPFYFLPPPL